MMPDIIRTGWSADGARVTQVAGGVAPVRVLHVVPELSSGGMERAMLRLLQRSVVQSGAAEAGPPVVHGVCVLRGVEEALAAECPAQVPMWVLGTGSGSRCGAWSCRRGLRRAIREFGADVVHARSTGAWFDAAVATLGLGRTRLLLSFHGRTHLGTPALSRRLMNSWVTGQADAVLAVSYEAEHHLRESWRVRPEKLHVIHNGVDPACFYPAESDGEVRVIRHRFHLTMRSRVAVCVANLMPIKGLEVLLRAWRPVCMAESAAQLLLVGDGPLRMGLERLAAELRCADAVQFLGSREDVPEILRAADAFVLPSRYEGCSNATLEAMASGLPVVACDVGGMRELVTPGYTGWLVPADDSEMLGRTLLAILLNASVRDQVGIAARDAVVKCFGIDTWVARHTALYRRLASGANLPAHIGEEAACAG